MLASKKPQRPAAAKGRGFAPAVFYDHSSLARFLITSRLSIVEANTRIMLKNTNVYQKPPNDTDEPKAVLKTKYHSIVENRIENMLKNTILRYRWFLNAWEIHTPLSTVT